MLYDYLKEVYSSYPIIITVLYLVIVIDIMSSFRFYYLNKYYHSVNKNLDSKRLEYLKSVVIHGYVTLATQDKINEALSKYRKLEETLGEPVFSFDEYEKTYLKQSKDAHTRGYV